MTTEGSGNDKLLVPAAVIAAVLAAAAVAVAVLLFLKKHTARAAKMKGMTRLDPEPGSDYEVSYDQGGFNLLGCDHR